MAPQPLSKVASGGELSRLSLAIQTAASQVAPVPTLVFDEVDAGIGGRAAEIVGKKIVIVANLEAAKLMGVESNGMVLAASSGGKLAVLSLDRDLPPGAKVT